MCDYFMCDNVRYKILDNYDGDWNSYILDSITKKNK